MNSQTDSQLTRYKKLLTYIEDNLSEDINIEQVEEVCHYSYRNINRIFEAIHQETIGKYIKRLRLEKGAQYLKYSDMGISDIGYEVGFEDRSAFSKAFKKKYHLSPQAYRENSEIQLEAQQKALIPDQSQHRTPLQFEIEYLPGFDSLFVEYRGSYKDINAMDEVWKSLFSYGTELKLVSDQTIFMTEIIDDIEISDEIHSRYNFCIILEQPLNNELKGLYRTKAHKRQKYAKFIHRGSHESSEAYYNQIYAFWMMDVGLEFADLPTIEFYPNFDEKLPASELITEIYIPVM